MIIEICTCPNCKGIIPAAEHQLITQYTYVNELKSMKTQYGDTFNLRQALKQLEDDPQAGVKVRMGTCQDCGTTRTVYREYPDGAKVEVLQRLEVQA